MTVTPYQPRWVRGRATTESERDAETRYLAICQSLQERPPERVLDFGAYGGYFSFRLAEDFGARVVAVDDHPELRRGIKANSNPLVEGIHRRMTPDEVRALGEFDAVLALSVLHHVPQWRAMLEAFVAVARNWLFIETPGRDEHLPRAVSPLDQIWTSVENLGGEAIAEVAGYDGRYKRELKVVRRW